MLPCVTISLVNEARGGPFVFWDDLEGSCRKAKELGFEAVEIFAPGAESLAESELRRAIDGAGVKLGAVGTGAGWVVHRLSLCSADASTRQRARDFVRRIIDAGAPFTAPAIIGSMQGRWEGRIEREQALSMLRESLADLGEHARRCGVPLILEPLNRYETNLVNTVADGLKLMGAPGLENARILCDLFHMNIEEEDISAALRTAGSRLGHVHFADSNRRPAGCGHIDFAAVAQALREVEYRGCLSAEALPYPNPEEAARMTIRTYRTWFGEAKNLTTEARRHGEFNAQDEENCFRR